MEIKIMSTDDAAASPAGKGREEPDALDMPNRPDIDWFKLFNPLRMLKHLTWKYKWLILKVLLLVFVVLFIVIFVYTAPTAIWGKLLP